MEHRVIYGLQKSWGIRRLRDCINHCLLKGSFPHSLKLANITPVHKKDEPTDKKNYRPVSVLPLLSNILERHSWSTYRITGSISE